MPNPITFTNPRGAGRLSGGHEVRLIVNQLSDAAKDHLDQLAKTNKRSAYLRRLIETDVANNK